MNGRLFLAFCVSLASLTAKGDCVSVPNATNAIRLNIYTNASPNAAGLFNTFDLEAYGVRLLEGVRNSSSNDWLHSILVDGKGPVLATTNSMVIVERSSGPDWTYVGLDATAAYRDRLQNYKRGILFVAPDLFVIYDHLVAKDPAKLQMVLHPPTTAQVDQVWRDLRITSPKAAVRIHAPGAKKMLRSWERVESAADQIIPHTVTMQLGPTNKVASLDLLTVFTVFRPGEKKDDDYAFSRLVESETAIGVRIHRDGWPTMVAFKLDPAAPGASLTGFGFNGPVGVDVFKPKRKIQ